MLWFLRPGITLSDAAMRIVGILIIIFLVMPLHECAHGLAAYKLGDKTAKLSGRLTLNPMAHIDPFGAAMMLLSGIGFARPVPIDPRNFKNEKIGTAITAFSGPLVNFLAAFLAAFLCSAMRFSFSSLNSVEVSEIVVKVLMAIFQFLYIFMGLNISLGIFNLIPVPPLDGSRILAVFLPQKLLYNYYKYERYFMFAVLFLLLSGFLSGPFSALINTVEYSLLKFTALPFGIKW